MAYMEKPKPPPKPAPLAPTVYGDPREQRWPDDVVGFMVYLYLFLLCGVAAGYVSHPVLVWLLTGGW